MPLERITIFCFGASYALALAFELLQLVFKRPALRWWAIASGAAGLTAHTLFLAVQRPLLASQAGSLLFLGWILAVFYVYGAVHYRRLLWGIFVLPLALGAVLLAAASFQKGDADPDAVLSRSDEYWRFGHVVLFVLASVGICVAAVASLMYLVQAGRLRLKSTPQGGLRLPSLERLESMNRRGINWAFPLLTVGLAISVIRMLQDERPFPDWADPRVIGTVLLWLLFAVLLYLRYGFHLRGKKAALLTLLAFALLILTLANTHSLSAGGTP